MTPKRVDVLEGYRLDAPDILSAFEDVSSADVYAHVTHLLPRTPALVADIGAGTGRDAAWFASQGHKVLAVEPTEFLRNSGRDLHTSEDITWLDDKLPELSRTIELGCSFDCVTLCGVWHHLLDAERAIAMPQLARLLKSGGRLILSLRHGPGAPRRPCHPSTKEGTIALAARSKLDVLFSCESESVLPANRARGVTRTWLVFQR